MPFVPQFPHMSDRDPGVLRANRLPLLSLQFQCCGKRPPLGLPEGPEADLCRGQEAARQVRGKGLQRPRGAQPQSRATPTP